MPTTIIPTIARSDTIDQWRIQTNKSATDLNDLGFNTYNKDQGQLLISNTANISITASGTPLSVANNVLFQSNLTLANNMLLGVVGAATGNLIAGGTIRVTGPGTALNVANNVLVGADVQVVNNVYVQNITANGNVSVTRNITSAGILRMTGIANVIYANTGTASINRVLSSYVYGDDVFTANLKASVATIDVLNYLAYANIGQIDNNLLNSNDINSNTLDTTYGNVTVLIAKTSANLVTLTSNVATVNTGNVVNFVSTNSTITNGVVTTGNVINLTSNVATINTLTALVGTTISGNVVTLNSNVATLNTGTITSLFSSNANVTNASITYLSSSNTITANTLISNNIEVSTANAAWINVSNNLSVKTGGHIRVYANTTENEVLTVDGKTTLQTAYIRGNIAVEGTWTALGNVEYEVSEFTLNARTVTNADATIRNNRIVGDDAFIRWDETDDQWKVSKGNTYTSLYGILDASFLNATVTSNSTANVATPSAVKAAYDTAVVAGGYANAAYTTANSASSYANGAFVAANSAGVYANAAFLASNTANTFLIDTSNTVGVFANGAYFRANTGLTHATAAYNQANTADQRAVTSGSYANAAYALSNTNAQSASSSGAYANSAFFQANTALVNAATADGKAVTAGITAAAAFTLANTVSAGSVDQYARPHSNAAFGVANTANALATGAVQRTSASSQTIASDLTINGNATFPNAKQLISYNAIISGTIAANTGFVTVNNGLLDTAGPSQSGGIRVKRGTSTDAFIRWNESISPPRWQYSDNAGNFVDFNAAALLSARSTNIAGGASNRIPVQNAADSTTFIDAPNTANRFLQWTGSGFAWASAATDLNNLSASNLTSGTVPSARMSGSYPIDISGKATTAGNADTVSNGVYTTQSYANPAFISSLAYGKLTGAPTIPTATSQLTNNSGFVTGTPWTSQGYVTSSGVTSVATGNGLTGGTLTSTGTISMSGSYSGAFYASGTITSGVDVVANSDRKLKENLEKIKNALSKVKQLTGYTYTRNDVEDQTERHTGLIAQDVEVVLPEAVTENGGIKGVAYGQMMGLICEAIKELDDKLEEIKKQLNN
jgi:hypothetical protein